ncbi:hypothetical protein [Actinomadura rubrisoli]|uniref:Uncharacterized protein n=1 Tax=Actinomadura rubrisoli TaxID=2530368 RepID=A0A4V2YZQ5_9ACTN|nr:hypothetical protein [Actinomadura rubrisoli]TDD97567.1 hypothetical protein E1298_00625 [Actinomadura rubrisoli]
MPEPTPAAERHTAATKLRKLLPGDLSAPPRLVMTDAETISGIAFCGDHLLPFDEEHQHSACDKCEVIDCKYAALAELVLALLLGREAQAVSLETVAASWPVHEARTSTAAAGSARRHALRIARAVNHSVAEAVAP